MFLAYFLLVKFIFFYWFLLIKNKFNTNFIYSFTIKLKTIEKIKDKIITIGDSYFERI